MKSKKFKEALYEFDTAIRLNHHSPHYHFMKGTALYEQGLYAQALECLHRALHENSSIENAKPIELCLGACEYSDRRGMLKNEN